MAFLIFQACLDGLDGAEALRAARHLAVVYALNLQILGQSQVSWRNCGWPVEIQTHCTSFLSLSLLSFRSTCNRSEGERQRSICPVINTKHQKQTKNKTSTYIYIYIYIYIYHPSGGIVSFGADPSEWIYVFVHWYLWQPKHTHSFRHPPE